MRKLLLSAIALGAALGMNALTYTDVTPAKFDFSKYEVGKLDNFWNECIDNQNHANATNAVVALGDKVTDEGYALFYGNPNGLYNANTFTEIVHVEGVGNVLQFGDTNSGAVGGGWGGCYFIPLAEQHVGTMRMTLICRGVKNPDHTGNTGASINIGVIDLAKDNPNLQAIPYAEFNQAGADNKWYKAVVEFAPTYALRLNFAQFIWDSYIQIAYLSFETIEDAPKDFVPEQQLYGPAPWEEVAPERPVVEETCVSVAGSFNDWKPELNRTYEIVDNCGTIVVDNWTNGQYGFKVLVNDNWLGNGATIANGEWYSELPDGENMWLPLDAEGQTVTFTIAVDTHSFKAEWTPGDVVFPALYLRGSFNDWGATEEYKFETEDGIYYVLDKVTMPLNGEHGPNFKIADAQWGSYNFGAAPDTDDTTVEPGITYQIVNHSDSKDFQLAEAFTGKVEVNLEDKTMLLTKDMSGLQVATVAAPAVRVSGRTVTFSANANVYTVSGAQVAAGTQATLLPGIYVARINDQVVKFAIK